jgi:hypothetical protein
MLNQLIDRIKSYFVSKKISENKEIDNNCSLRFELIDNDFNILCYWPNLDEMKEKEINQLANYYGTLIYMADRGLLKQDIIDALSSVSSKNNPSDTYFVFEVMNKWFKLVENEENSKSAGPIVPPSSVFNNYIHKS